jgi:hypothetical protein
MSWVQKARRGARQGAKRPSREANGSDTERGEESLFLGYKSSVLFVLWIEPNLEGASLGVEGEFDARNDEE